MRLVLRLDLPADARFLPMARRAMEEYLDEAGLLGDERADLVLALDEACANVIRHAFPGGSGRISMTAELCEEQVVVQVDDDGVGFDASATPERGRRGRAQGLANIRRRAELLGATLDIESVPGRGTRLSLRMPVATARRPT